jgi:hypothetical protein
MNWFRSRSQNKISASAESIAANPNWRTYRAGEGDRAGRRITKVYAVDDNYVIYFIGCELYYETTTPGKDLASADAALARINRLLDTNPSPGTREYEINVSTLELAGDAFEMFFSGERTEALEILNSLRDKLQAKEEGQRRLFYQLGTFLITSLAWILYLWLLNEQRFHPGWEPWILAAVLAMAGGLFSVCATIGSLEVNVNQKHFFLFVAGTTRAIVALLAGAALLLAMRSKMFAGITYEANKVPYGGDPLTVVEMFFCFLAGFSESFVPNILSKAADKKTANVQPSDGKPTDGQSGDGKGGAAHTRDQYHDTTR